MRRWGTRGTTQCSGSEPMSTHMSAERGQIAPRALMPGDPLRARWIAEHFPEGAAGYSQVRGMLGFTRAVSDPCRGPVEGHACRATIASSSSRPGR